MDILVCSEYGGIGINLGFIPGTVSCGILEPSPVSISAWNTILKYSIFIPSAGTIVINLTIGTKGMCLIQQKPIVPLADTVIADLFTLALLVKPYRPSFSAPLANIGMENSSVCVLE